MTLLDGKVLIILSESKSCVRYVERVQKNSWIMLKWTHQNLSQDMPGLDFLNSFLKLHID